MDANRFMSVSLDLWNNAKIRGLMALRKGEDPMLTTGRFVRLLAFCYDFDGVIDWEDGLTRIVVSDGLHMDEGEAGAFIGDLAKVAFFDKAIWESERHAVSDGVCGEIAYREESSQRGKRAASARWGKGGKTA